MLITTTDHLAEWPKNNTEKAVRTTNVLAFMHGLSFSHYSREYPPLAIDAMAILSCCYLALGLSYKFGGPTSVRLNVWPAVCEI